MHKRIFILPAAALLMSLATSVFAQPHPMDAGVHYAELGNPLPTQTEEDVIEVLDVFWYGCPVCMEFEPMMSYYGGQLRGDLTMRRMPAIWNAAMHNQAQVYYTAVELDRESQAHEAAFRYLQEDKQTLNTPEQASVFFGTLGISEDEFDRAWNSAAVAVAVARAEEATEQAGIDRLPALLVNGRFQVTRNSGVTTLPDMVIIANQLIRVLRDERRID